MRTKCPLPNIVLYIECNIIRKHPKPTYQPPTHFPLNTHFFIRPSVRAFVVHNIANDDDYNHHLIRAGGAGRMLLTYPHPKCPIFCSICTNASVSLSIRSILSLQEWEAKAATAKEDYGKRVKEFEANGGSATGGGDSKKRSKTSKKPAKKAKKKDSDDDDESDDGSD